MMSNQKKRLRFTDVEDLLLLREVLSSNPFENQELWKTIQENISLITGKLFSIRTLKEHLLLLIKLWAENVKVLKDKSGIEIEYTEKDNLCESIHSLMSELKKEKTVNKMNTADKKLGMDARDKWSHLAATTSNPERPEQGTSQSIDCEIHSIFHDHFGLVQTTENAETVEVSRFEEVENVVPNFQDTNVQPIVNQNCIPLSTAPTPTTSQQRRILTPVTSRTRKRNVQRQGLQYLTNYDEAQQKIKRKELELEERKLAVEERKVALEEKRLDIAHSENKRKFELEEKKLDILSETVKEVSNIISRQETIINLLLKQNKNN